MESEEWRDASEWDEAGVMTIVLLGFIHNPEYI